MEEQRHRSAAQKPCPYFFLHAFASAQGSCRLCVGERHCFCLSLPSLQSLLQLRPTRRAAELNRHGSDAARLSRTTAQPDIPTNLAHQGHQEPQPAQEPMSASDISDNAHRATRTDALSSATAQIFQNRPLRVGIISLWEQPVTTEALMNTLNFENPLTSRIFMPSGVCYGSRAVMPKDKDAKAVCGICVKGRCTLRMLAHNTPPYQPLKP